MKKKQLKLKKYINNINNKMKIISFIILFPYILLLYTLNPYDVIDHLNLIKEDEKELKHIINNISKTFSEAHAPNEISKNTPQPDFDKNYHNKVDIQNLLKKINLTNIGFYDFEKFNSSNIRI